MLYFGDLWVNGEIILKRIEEEAIIARRDCIKIVEIAFTTRLKFGLHFQRCILLAD
jgi:hypothetical protein